MKKKILSVIVVLLMAAAGLEVLIYRQIAAFLRPPKPGITINPNSLLLNVNEVQFKAQDGVELHGWLIPGKAGYPVFIIAHNYGSDRAETLGKLEALVSDLNKQGYFVFLFDFRGHGASGSNSGIGYREADDVDAALRVVLKYRQIGRRIGVLGIGMGAIAAARASSRVDEVKLVILDSIYSDVPERVANSLLADWPPGRVFWPALLKVVDWNLMYMLKLKDTRLNLAQSMPLLYNRPVVFVETTPPNGDALKLYDATKEPKELLQLGQTAADDLMGDARARYREEIQKEITKYFPPITDQQTLELPK